MAESKKSGPPTIKGAALLGFLKYIKGKPNGEELLKKVIDAMPPELAPSCRQRVVAVAEYPYALFVAFIRAADKTLGRGDLSICKELGKATALRDIESVGQLFQREPRIEDLYRSGDVYWKSYHLNSGSWKVEDTNPEQTVMRIYDFPEMDPAHCRLMEGWMTQAMISCGVLMSGEVREVKCMSQGDPYHEFIARWRAKAGK